MNFLNSGVFPEYLNSGDFEVLAFLIASLGDATFLGFNHSARMHGSSYGSSEQKRFMGTGELFAYLMELASATMQLMFDYPTRLGAQNRVARSYSTAAAERFSTSAKMGKLLPVPGVVSKSILTEDEMCEILEKVLHLFGHKEWKSDAQRKLCVAVVERVASIFGCLRTGGGKTLAILCALLVGEAFAKKAPAGRSHLVLVLVPFRTILTEQFKTFRSIRPGTAWPLFSDSLDNFGELKLALEQVAGQCHLVLTTPEYVQHNTGFQELILQAAAEGRLGHIICDEVHEWSDSDFRPSFNYLKQFLQASALSSAQFIGLSGTLDQTTKKDLIATLRRSRGSDHPVDTIIGNLQQPKVRYTTETWEGLPVKNSTLVEFGRRWIFGHVDQQRRKNKIVRLVVFFNQIETLELLASEIDLHYCGTSGSFFFKYNF